MEAKDGHRLLTPKIVGSYLRHHKVGASQLPDLIAIVHRSFGELGKQPAPEEELTPAVSVRQSVRDEYVVCLDCGYRGKTLRRHISSRHGLNRDEYLRRWGLRPDHPLTAPAYSERRSTLAKQLGLGRKPGAEAAAASRRTTRSGSSKTRQRRPRSRVAPPQSEPLPPTAEA
jgi:predicted transcriptional regulator